MFLSSVHRVRSMPTGTPSCPRCVCVLVSDVIYVTGASSEPFKPIDNKNRLSSNEEGQESIVPKRSESNLNR